MIPDLSSLQTALERGPAKLSPLPPSALTWIGIHLLRADHRPQLWVAAHLRELEQLACCLRTWDADPRYEIRVFHGLDKPEIDLLGCDLETVCFLDQPEKPPFILLTTPQGLAKKIPAEAEKMTVQQGDSLSPDQLLHFLDRSGFSLDIDVYEKGTAARRGGIVDLWPAGSDLPVRIEFFGNQIDSLRSFDPSTQRSVEKIGQCTIPALNAGGDIELAARLPSGMRPILHGLPPSACLLPEGAATAIETGCVTTDTLEIGLESYDTGLRPASEQNPPVEAERQRTLFLARLDTLAREGWRIDLFMETPGAADRLRELCAAQAADGHPAEGLRISVGLLHGCFSVPQQRYRVLTEAGLYGSQPKTAHLRRGRKPTTVDGPRVAEWSEIQPGERVVHADHGIGKYLGLVEMEMAGRRQEMLLLEYAGGARLYLPAGQAHLLTRYTGLGGTPPPLHSLRGARWQNERASAEAAIEDLAARLLETQAARALHKSRACGPDSPLQAEFENAFPYLETPDQQAAIEAVKADLEAPRPMDRLVCGDAGYGKTEVAMRAAFKTVLDGRQVALLVPTTVLAQQHFDTFSERMAAYPVQIEMLSRFRSRQQQNQTLHRLRTGDAQIVIGTHRLVSGDVHFRDLGLVIIDEEQRFGVRAKEHLKQLRRQVDVLTLSATPIPRTLYMGLTGARDLSLIQTPPQERQPVETIVLEYHEEILREAIEHELARDGQVFYLHNRVQTIGKVADTLSRLVPQARVAFAHGQMNERELSTTMHRFVRGETDVLICTTLIESGLDIPRVNTILIDRADRFGLADLYQLRGRVGRSRLKAYAFLLLPPGGTLTDDARKRVEALKTFCGHGAGFRIAMRDLEIRGAGHLLGEQQSGHIAAIGFDLYCQLLKRSIARLQGRKVPPLIDTVVDLDFIDRSAASAASDHSACIPADYAEDENVRVKLYARIASLSTESEVRSLRQELNDRFGKPPPAIRNLLDIARIRIAAAQAGIRSVRVSGDRLLLLKSGEAVMPDGRYPRLQAATLPGKLKEIRGAIVRLSREGRHPGTP